MTAYLHTAPPGCRQLKEGAAFNEIASAASLSWRLAGVSVSAVVRGLSRRSRPCIDLIEQTPALL
jgi:hypothetical protein